MQKKSGHFSGVRSVKIPPPQSEEKQFPGPPPPRKLLDHVRDVLRVNHYSIKNTRAIWLRWRWSCTSPTWPWAKKFRPIRRSGPECFGFPLSSGVAKTARPVSRYRATETAAASTAGVEQGRGEANTAGHEWN